MSLDLVEQLAKSRAKLEYYKERIVLVEQDIEYLERVIPDWLESQKSGGSSPGS